MNLYHYSAKPFTLDNERIYTQDVSNFKPRGLWLSAEEGTRDDLGWKQWCEGEEYNVEGLAHRTKISLRSAEILIIDDADALDAFTSAYRLTGSPRDTLRAIDWSRVVARYDGILIAPYIWERRMTPHTFWYYCWDCASACIWNSRVLEVDRELAEANAMNIGPYGVEIGNMQLVCIHTDERGRWFVVKGQRQQIDIRIDRKSVV